jgi:cytoskeletal protein RodZ
MNKRLWITCLIVLLVLIAFAVWKSTASSAATQQTKNEQSSNHTVSNSNDMQNKSKDEILQQSLQHSYKLYKIIQAILTSF